MNDNRNYRWTDKTSIRPEFSCIMDWIMKNSRVLDLGCGNGSLLALLKEEKNITEFGIEISQSGIDCCIKKGVNARQGTIDVELKDIPDNSFEFSICSVTIQMAMYPEITLREMKRVSKYQIVSFPNFAYLPNRLELLLRGRMPRKLLSGYYWYNTGHIHQFSIKDFKEMITAQIGLKIKACRYFGGARNLSRIAPNLLAATGLFLMEKQL
ncbi:MAG: methionine biosynthesis protein MetW [Phycisphaerae bacterium]|nr:methionine biosynthesis protein MetW [Phycisphaerae bacterium]